MTSDPKQQKRNFPRYSRVGFWISLITFLVLFGLLVFGGLLGFSSLVRMLWAVITGN